MSARTAINVKRIGDVFHWKMFADDLLVDSGLELSLDAAYDEAERVQGMVVAESDGGLTDEFWDQIEAQRIKLRGLDGKPLYLDRSVNPVRVQVKLEANGRHWWYRLITEDRHVVYEGRARFTSRTACVEQAQKSLDRYRTTSEDGWEEVT